MWGDSEMLIGISAIPSQQKDWDLFSWGNSFVLLLSLGRRKLQCSARAPSHPSGFPVPPSLCCWARDGASGDADCGGDAGSQECWRAPPAHPAAWPQGSISECRWSLFWGRAGDLGQESLCWVALFRIAGSSGKMVKRPQDEQGSLFPLWRAEEFILVCYGQSQTAQVGIICFREHQMSSEWCLGLQSFYVTQSIVSEHWEVRLGWNWDRNLALFCPGTELHSLTLWFPRGRSSNSIPTPGARMCIKRAGKDRQFM